MNRKDRRKAGKKNPPIPTSFDKPISAVSIRPEDPSYGCCGDRGQGGCSMAADFLILAEKNGEQWGFPACQEHAHGVATLIDSRSPKHPPRTDIAECAKDLEAGLNALGLTPETKWAEGVLDRGGVHLMPCPVCSDAGIEDHLLKVRKDGDTFSVEAVAA